MHVLGLGLHLLIAVLCAVHAVRSRQEPYWLFVLFLFPLIGSVVYILAILLPDVSQRRGPRHAVRRLRHAIDPTRDLRTAQDSFHAAPTVENTLRFADALVARNQAAQAVPLYRSTLNGVHAHDPAIEVRLARALLESGQAASARELLETLIRRHPDFRSPEGHLTYARALAAEGQREAARNEFETLVGYSAGLEARAVYVEQLRDWGDHEAAQRLREEGLRAAQRMPRSAQEINRPWIERLQRLS
ncbi:MAG TPA: tetratricopeptide repeat protein [Xanthomonadaceae bacterium]|nr:tetratricopeptide repeat protein [Xanthomonadaceae bacterium]